MFSKLSGSEIKIKKKSWLCFVKAPPAGFLRVEGGKFMNQRC